MRFSASSDWGLQQLIRHRRIFSAARFWKKWRMLGMTDAQKTQIHAILRDSQPNLQPLVKQYLQERRGSLSDSCSRRR